MHSIDLAVARLREGKMVIIIDDEDRENEGDLVFAGQFADLPKMQFMLQHTCGIVCLSMQERMAAQLGIGAMSATNHSHQQTPFGMSIEAATGVTTGVSAQDRVTTILAAMNEKAVPTDLVRPGHVFPLISKKGGVLERLGHTEASVDLMQIANLSPGAVICELTNSDGTLMRANELAAFSQQFDIPIVHVQTILQYRLQHDDWLVKQASATLPVDDGDMMQVQVYQSQFGGVEHVALVSDVMDLSEPVLVRVHSECLTGDVFHSARCDCGEQLALAKARIIKENGVLIYLRQEGRGIGLANKIRAYHLQELGYDTVQANEQLGFEADQRDYHVAAKILQDLTIHRVRLLTNNPKKMQGLTGMGIEVVERVPLLVESNKYNEGYLSTKREKLGHLLT